MSDPERLAAILHEKLLHNGRGGVDESLAAMSCKQDGADGRCSRWAASLIAAGVRVPAEPEAPDLRRCDFDCHYCATYGHEEPPASQPVPAPEPLPGSRDLNFIRECVARNPGGYTDTFKYLLSLIPPQLPSGDAPDLREAAKALVDALDHDLFYDRQLAALRAALAASAPPPTGSSSRELADLDVERLRAAYHAEYTSGDNRCEHGVRWDCRDRAEETVHWDRLARAYAEQDATPEGEA